MFGSGYCGFAAIDTMFDERYAIAWTCAALGIWLWSMGKEVRKTENMRLVDGMVSCVHALGFKEYNRTYEQCLVCDTIRLKEQVHHGEFLVRP
jgi:hypothetical protein